MSNPDDRTVAVVSTGSPTSSIFWCHECELSVDFLPSPILPVCPHCSSDFLEEMMDPQIHSDSHPFDDDDSFQFFDHNPFLSTDDGEEDYEDPELEALGLDIDDGRPLPAPKSSIDAIPTVEITAEFIGSPDSSHLCAVCKDEFALGTEAKRLPCRHIYHEGCIVPWLSLSNSCPVCRAKLPVTAEERERHRQRRGNGGVVRVVRFGDLVEEEDVVLAPGNVVLSRTMRGFPDHISQSERVLPPSIMEPWSEITTAMPRLPLWSEITVDRIVDILDNDDDLDHGEVEEDDLDILVRMMERTISE